jgi:CubicO group peptidase (beta-lactamase class C family)
MASVSKLFTATLLGLAVQDGRVDLDAPIDRYVNGFPRGDRITTRQLAGHLSGLGHYQEADRLGPSPPHYDSVIDALEVFKASPPVGPPGRDYLYSTHGFTLLSAVLERAIGEPFLDAMQSRVFGPLGMRSAAPYQPGQMGADMSDLYIRRQGRATLVDRPADPSYSWGGAGFASTPSDLVRLAPAYWNGMLRPETVAEMWKSQRNGAGDTTGVGIAWRTGVGATGRRIAHHAGADQGARVILVAYPEDRVAIATTTNTVWTSVVLLNAEMFREALEATSAPDTLPQGEFRQSGTFGKTAAAGRMRVSGRRAEFEVPAPMKAWFASRDMGVDWMPAFAITDSLWGLVTPFGVADLRMRDGRGEVRWSDVQWWQFKYQP